MRVRTDWLVMGLTTLAVAGVVRYADLTPRVESDFFFAEDDPQLRATGEIRRRFPSPEQIIVRAAGPDLAAPGYRSAVATLADSLRDVEGVTAVYSVATEDPASPLWSRLLTTPDSAATNLIVQVDDTDPGQLVPEVERVVAGIDDPGVSIQLSGVPYVVELIRRSLIRDFVTFSLAALLLFGVAIGIVYRAWSVVAGTLTACLLACAATLTATTLLGVRIGLLTANIVTIVFVLTLSHAVFLTSNWRRALTDGGDPVSRAMSATVPASFWCMATTLLGFLALLFASARPLRELGIAGAIGTLIALLVAFGVYPVFLRAAATGPGTHAGGVVTRFAAPPRRRFWLLALAAVVLSMAPGVWRLDTEPSLLSYFASDTELRDGLEAIDADGGSSPLYFVVRPSDGLRIDTTVIYERMWDLQEEFEGDPAIGVVLSPAPLLSHARRQPLAGLLGLRQLVDILDTPLFDHIVRSFVSDDRREALFFLRMREAEVAGDRAATVERLRGVAAGHGFDVVLSGGAYELQAQLGRLIARSLRFGLGGLIVLFVGIAFVVSRRPAWTVAMVAGLAAIPTVVLGAMGHLRLPLDIVTSPAANIALAMGVDSMIHLVMRVRKLLREGSDAPAAWATARAQLFSAILGATLIISSGFGIFALSQFPPTQRFGLAVILGTLTAATMALVGLPLMAGRRGE